MKSIKLQIAAFLMALTFVVSCKKEETQLSEEQILVRATPEEFANLKAGALEGKIQEFQFDASITSVFTTEKGVHIVMYGSCLTKNGNPVTGMVDVKVVELFERGGMLTSNKPTMGMMPNGDMALLISGGEFFINATHEGDQLDLDCNMQVVIPTDLTWVADTEMTLWHGRGRDNDCDGIENDCDGNVWEEVENGGQPEQVDAVQGDNGENYVTAFGEFGWTNVDKFFSDQRPKTTLLVDVPDGFDHTNSSVYISYNGEPNALGNLDTYIESSELFSEHYGQIPIGLECNIIFVSEDNGNWLYAIKSATIVDGETIVILVTDLSTATSSDLETLVNNLP